MMPGGSIVYEDDALRISVGYDSAHTVVGIYHRNRNNPDATWSLTNVEIVDPVAAVTRPPVLWNRPSTWKNLLS